MQIFHPSYPCDFKFLWKEVHVFLIVAFVIESELCLENWSSRVIMHALIDSLIPLSFSLTDQPYWVPALEKLHPSGHQAWQLPHGTRQERKPCLRDWPWSCQEISGRTYPSAHSLPWEQESDRHCKICLDQYPPWNRYAIVHHIISVFLWCL